MPKDQLYATWKQHPDMSVVIDPQAIDSMLGGTKEVTNLVLHNLIECFSDKTILVPDSASDFWTMNQEMISDAYEKKGKLTILSGVPGVGKTTYAKHIMSNDDNAVLVSNDSLRGAVTGVAEDQINEKIWNTVTQDEEWNEVSMEYFSAPLMNRMKDTIIKTLTKQGYHVLADAVHPKGFMWDSFDEKFASLADIEHVLLVPDTIHNAISYAQSRKERPESKWTIMKVSGWIKEMLNEKKSDGTPVYKFDEVVVNHYVNGWFEHKTSEEFFESLNIQYQNNLLQRMLYAWYFLDDITQQQLREQLEEIFQWTLSWDWCSSLADIRATWQQKPHTKFLHHYTIKYLPKYFMPIKLGNKKDLHIIGVAYDDKGWTLVLQDDECKEVFQPQDDGHDCIEPGVFPHITIATIGDPSYSKTLISRAQRDDTIIKFDTPIIVPAKFGYATKKDGSLIFDHQSLYLYHRLP